MTELQFSSTFVADSSETKPTLATTGTAPQNGTTILEADTGKVYIYNAVTDSWGEL